MRRLFIIRKDLHLSEGKLMAMVGHCCEAYWTNFLKNGELKDLEFVYLPTGFPDIDESLKYRHPAVSKACKEAYERGEKYFKFLEENPEKKYWLRQKIDKDIWDEYVNGIFTKTVCEAKNLTDLKKVEDRVDILPNDYTLTKDVDYGYINDKCLTELTPENEDGTTTIGVWFRPIPDEISQFISKKYKLYGAFDKKRNCDIYKSYDEARNAYLASHAVTDTNGDMMKWLFEPYQTQH